MLLHRLSVRCYTSRDGEAIFHFSSVLINIEALGAASNLDDTGCLVTLTFFFLGGSFRYSILHTYLRTAYDLYQTSA